MDLSTIRQLNEMALAAGRERQSKQTGYIHYFYPDVDKMFSKRFRCSKIYYLF